MDHNFRKWACSFSGCDGGNVDAETWLCGIEWGGGSVEGYYDNSLPKEISEGHFDVPLDKFDWKESIAHRYGISFAKLYMAIQGGEVTEYPKVAELNGKELFKLNLYPVAFDSTNHKLWHEHKLDRITGFESKYLFNIWCFFNRFPHFASLREKHKPKLIICTGIDYVKDFLMFFGGGSSVEKLQSDFIVPASETNKYNRQYYWLRLQPETLLVVIPFLSGRYGLNSNYLLQEMGNRIRMLMAVE